MTRKAIVIGASGLIGRTLLNILLSNPYYDEVMVIVRKKMDLHHSKLQQLVIDFDHLDIYTSSITGDVMFSCLGSTKGQSPVANEYRKIDHDYPVRLAEIGLRNGIKQFHIVSSVGASYKATSSYLKLKGETEEDLKKVGFDSLFIYQPSVLIGERKHYRPMEKFAVFIIKAIGPLLLGGWGKFIAMPAETLAKAMFNSSLNPEKGIHTYTFNKIKQLS